MPDRDVQNIQDLIFYQYAKIIVKSAMKSGDNEAAKKQHYGMIKQKFRELKSGKISWSDILREDLQFAKSEQECIYCGSKDKLTIEHIIPKSISINERCSACDKIQGIHNIMWACSSCNSKKHTKGLYTYYHELYPNKKKSDLLPSLLEKKYLKLMWCCHRCAGTLESSDLNKDGVLDVLDIDEIINLYTK